MAKNIADTFVGNALLHGERIGIVEAKNGKCITFARLNDKADTYAHFFADGGIHPGDVVILMVTPSIEFVCLTLALFKLGSPIVLIDPGMGYKNLLRCIERVEPKVLIGMPKAILFSKLFPKVFTSVQKRFCCGKSFGLLGNDITRCLQKRSNPYDVYQPSDTDLAAIIFTTGSTGPPKGVRYEHSIFSAQLRLVKEYYGITPDDVDQPAFPLFALFSAAIGACSVIPDMDSSNPANVNPAKFVESIKKYGVTYSFGSPAIWNVVSNYCIKNNILLQGLEKVLMAGAPVHYDLLQRVRSIVHPDASVFTPYGATESLPIVSIESREVLHETWQQSLKGQGTCVGHSLPGIEIRIIEISEEPISHLDQKMLLQPGEIGEIIVRGDVVTKAYQNNQVETTLAKIQDKKSFWHRMGDVGYVDEQQRLWFCGRKAHRVITTDGTLYSIPCEEIINEHPSVYRSALVGIKKNPNDLHEDPVIVVEPNKNSNKNEKDLLLEVKELAGKSVHTKMIHRFIVHHDFPVDIRHNAKIFREKLSLWAQGKIYPH